MKFAVAIVGAVVISLSTLLTVRTTAHACTFGPASWRFHASEFVVSGRVQGYETVDDYAGEPGRTSVRYGLIVHNVYKGDVPRQFAFIDSGVQWDAQEQRIVPDTTCGGLAGDPTDAYVLIGLNRNLLGDLTTSGAFIFFRGASHASPEFEAAVESFDGPPGPEAPDVGTGFDKSTRQPDVRVALFGAIVATIGGFTMLVARR